MSGHTPGPWGVCRFAIKALCNGVKIATIEVSSERGQLGRREREIDAANARLMAAAPELLEAASEAFDFLGGVDGAAEIRAKLLAAISKAEGGAV